ncbi:hypothetical protein N7456_007995 [Penicillium angulare]|uniref:Uncharacterized protein n=1 Tax=Penicillium angulare TaxID=116970 RepID=A0A9W9K8P3_9EURO|nr:hypothetical protein N7456_007995 [Penicillium angulare]
MSSSTLGPQSALHLGHNTPSTGLTSQESHHKPVFTGSWTAPFRDGLPTPPGDMTGITYNAFPPAAHGGKVPGMSSHYYNNHMPPFDSMSSSMVTAVKPSNPAPTKDLVASEPPAKKSTGTSSGSQLRIPSSINNSKGNLAEFAAQMTCLFWFEKTPKLQDIEERRHPVPSLVAEAIPTVGFQRWVSGILSTTQVSQNVILLALLFVYRLKKFNAGVKGKKGSEYRLMTVALMLGNKFLDDNTYTNKTWAEVSGIAVQEIHVMEVEFLSNIRYDLFASETEWSRWHTKLGLFGDYFNAASMLPVESEAPVLRISPPRLQPQSPSSKLPSPPSDQFRPQSQPNWYMPVSGLPYPTPHLGELTPGASRKRSRDDETDLQPVKRIVRPASNPAPVPGPLSIPSNALNAIPTLPPVLTPTAAPVAQGSGAGNVSRLPPLNMNLPPTSNPMPQSLSTTVASQLPMPSALMPPVYSRPSNWIQPQQMPSAAVPPVAYNAPQLPDLGRHHQNPYGVSSSTVSPAVSAYSVHTPQTHLSPSFFLANRNSPYRPVRSVSTLLIPPPSTSMQQQRSVPFDHMHYQPLSKGSVDRKTGLLPYIPSESWYQNHANQPFYTPSQTFSG